MQDKMIQELQNKLQELKTSNRELSENFEYKELQLLENIATCDKARSELFNAQAKLNVFQRKEDEWLKCQSELENLKVKFVLQGELGRLIINNYVIKTILISGKIITHLKVILLVLTITSKI